MSAVQSGEVFRLPTWPWLAVFAVPLGAFALRYGTPGLAVGALLLAYTFWSSRIAIGPSGISLSPFGRLAWDDVTSARVRSVSGLPYLHVRRRRRPRVWIPLYLVGEREVQQALIEYAPSENPIALCLPARVRIDAFRLRPMTIGLLALALALVALLVA